MGLITASASLRPRVSTRVRAFPASARPDPLGLRAAYRHQTPSPEQVLRLVEPLPTPWKTTLREEFAGSAGLREGYSLGHHTRLVLRQHRKYFPQAPVGMTRTELDVTLALHDGGKSAALRNGGTHLQHRFTLELLDAVRPHLPFSSVAMARMRALIGGDPLGLYLRGQLSINAAEAQLRAAAKRAQMSPSDFFELLTVYYQSDASSYTADAGSTPGLERVFSPRPDGRLAMHASGRRLAFCDENELLWSLLATRLGRPASPSVSAA